jgi:hypothetical protein
MNEDIRDIHGPIVHAASSPWWPYAVAAAVAACLAVAAVVWWRRRRARALPSDQVALRELAAARAAIGVGDPHDVSLRVSDAVRRYVEATFDIHAPRRTTEELLNDLMRASSPVAPYRAELGTFLELCDLAKYARFALSAQQMTDIVDHAEGFVRATAGKEATA